LGVKKFPAGAFCPCRTFYEELVDMFRRFTV
jgi:hypothetical protein